MNLQGVIITYLVGLSLFILIVALVRAHKLTVSFGVLWLFPVLGLLVIVSVPGLPARFGGLPAAASPISALGLSAFVFMLLGLIYISVQVTLLSARQAELVQKLALGELLAREESENAAAFDLVLE